MENKQKHLEMIQNIIGRMSNSSFLIKGWCITLISVLLAIGTQNTNIRLILITLLPLIMFWILDAYYLRQERLFRKLYTDTCLVDENIANFSMNTSPFIKTTPSWIKTAFSSTLVLFYGIILFAIFIFITFINK